MSLENYMPDFALEKAYDVTVDSLKKHGIKVVLVDLDNTLIAWNNPDGTPEMRQWLHDLRDAGIPVVVVSNNKYERVKRAVEKFGIEFEAFAQTFARVIQLGAIKIRQALGIDQHLDAMRLELDIVAFLNIHKLELIRHAGTATGAHTKAQADPLAAFLHIVGNVFCCLFRKRNCH